MVYDPRIDMSKLTQRELLILLNQQVKEMSDKLNSVADDHVKLRERVSNIETRPKVVSAVWGVASVCVSIIINVFRTIK